MKLPVDPVEIWRRISDRLGSRNASFGEFFDALRREGYSEGAVDGIFDTIEASGVCSVSDDWHFTERTGRRTRFVVCCDLCGSVLSYARRGDLRRAAKRHERAAARWPAHATGKPRYTCLSRPKKILPHNP